jgi:class 3 adenylate cyclase/streptogramin lyase
MTWKNIILSLFILLFLYSADAQNAGAGKRNIKVYSGNLNENLSQGFVSCMIQDHKGFLWFATKDGLNKYDGYKFTVYRHEANDTNSIGGNFIINLFEDSRGYIWIFDASNHSDVFNPEDETFYHIRSSFSGNWSAIGEDVSGNFWFLMDSRFYRMAIHPKGKAEGTSFGNKYDYKAEPAAEALKEYGCSPAGEINFLDIDASGAAWYATPDSLFGLSLKAGSIGYHTKISLSGIKIKGAFKKVITDMVHHSQYFLSEDGILVYDLEKKQFREINTIRFPGLLTSSEVAQDQSGNLWICCDEKVHYLNTSLFELKQVELKNPEGSSIMVERIKSMVLDRSNILWVGTNGYGIFKYNPRVEKFNTIPFTETRQYISNIYMIKGENNRDMYLNMNMHSEMSPLPANIEARLTLNAAIAARLGFKENRLNGMPGNCIEESKDHYWLNYGFGYIGFYDAHNDKLILYKAEQAEENIYASYLWLDPQNNPWLLTTRKDNDRHIQKFNKENKKFEPPVHLPGRQMPAVYDFVSRVLTGSKGEFWFGTIEGLYSYQPATNEWNSYYNIPGNSNKLSYDVVFSIYMDPQMPAKYLWIGTNSGGLDRLDLETKSFEHFTDKNGLPNNVVYGILPDNAGNLWLSTNKGICRFNIKTSSCKNYYASDGLQGNEFNRYAYYKTASGTLYFGGVSGFNFFKPEEVNISTNPPLISFTSFRISNKPVNIFDKNSPIHKHIDYTDAIVLTHDQNMISFEFAALDFAAPEKNQYRYKLEGFDNEWNYSGTLHEATYTNLYPGSYSFNVQAANSDGTWNETGRTIYITVKPPWWKTWWAYLLFACLIVSGIILYIRRHTANLRKNQKILEHKVALRTKELQAEKQKSEDLLLNILPVDVAEELKEKGKSEARFYENVTVLFTDFVNFTGISESLSPNQLVDEIGAYFKEFDEIVTRNHLEKIKTIGDAYLAVCGLPVDNHTHAVNTVNAALEIIEYVKQKRKEGGLFDIRIGVNSGSVIAGIVGLKKYAYDIWGDTVNTAARMEQNSEPGKINISGSTYGLVKKDFNCTYRGKIDAKNKGEIDMYFVNTSLAKDNLAARTASKAAKH